jgi:hypothetical protein
MLMPLLLFGAQLVARADELNAALTKCLFATAREAHAQGEAADRFRATLGSACLAEEASMRAAAVSILVRRGVARAAAEAKIDETLRNGRAAVIQAYSYAPAGQ